MTASKDGSEQLGRDWWRTAIIDMGPGVIRCRGYAVEDLIRQGMVLTEMVWRMTRGDLPSAGQAELLEAARMSAVDHGPQAPSIAIARMAATCGVGLNGAIASGLNALGDVHGGAGEQALALLRHRGETALQRSACPAGGGVGAGRSCGSTRHGHPRFRTSLPPGRPPHGATA